MEVTEKAQEPKKEIKGYKVTSGEMKAKNEAMSAVVEAKKKGFTPAVVIVGDIYKLLYAEPDKKAEASEIVKAIKAAGLTAEVHEG